jgi:dTDP-4-amino-4,6-dideoxygalactose transaminase
MNVPFLDLPGQHQAIRKEVEEGFATILRDASFILGPSVKEFEETFSRFLGVGEAVGVANGTDALILALKAVGVGPGDEVITAVNSFVATAEAIAHTGARPVFVDVEPNTYAMNAALLLDAITKRTKAIIPVHLYGQPADLDGILAFARARGLRVVEDAAQAHGATYRGRRVGTVGEAGCFSFYPGKNLGACGDAGAVVTTDPTLADTVRKLRDHGGSRKHQHDLVGYNSRLDSLQAVVLLVKLRYLDQWNALRQEHAQLYSKLLSGIPGITTPTIREGCTHVFHLYVILASGGKRDALQSYLRQEGIATGIHYPTPLHLTPAFSYLGYRFGDFPVAEACANQVLSLPMFPELTPRQIEYVADRIRHFMEAKT